MNGNLKWIFACDCEGIGQLRYENKIYLNYEKLKYWMYEEACYLKYLSDVVLDGARNKKLERVEEAELQGIKLLMEHTGRVMYQEMMISEYRKALEAAAEEEGSTQ